MKHAIRLGASITGSTVGINAAAWADTQSAWWATPLFIEGSALALVSLAITIIFAIAAFEDNIGRR